MTTKTLRVDLADLEGIPHAVARSGTSVRISASYTSTVILEADGRIIPPIIKTETMGASGRVQFTVWASDSEEVREEYRGFAVKVTASIREPNGAERKWHRTVKPMVYQADIIRLGRLPAAEPLPREWVSVGEVLANFTARIDGLEAGKANVDHTHTPADVGAVPATRWLAGTGAPEGVLAAPVGTVYTDSAATFGAIEWIKTDGTGTSGWRVTKGDTGLVDVTSQITIGGSAPISGDKVEVQRTPHHLTLQIALAARSSPASPLHVTLPTWARPGRIRTAAVSSGGGTPTRMLYAAGSNDQVSLYSLTASTAHYVDGLVLPIAPTVASPWRTA